MGILMMVQGAPQAAWDRQVMLRQADDLLQPRALTPENEKRLQALRKDTFFLCTKTKCGTVRGAAKCSTKLKSNALLLAQTHPKCFRALMQKFTETFFVPDFNGAVEDFYGKGPKKGKKYATRRENIQALISALRTAPLEKQQNSLKKKDTDSVVPPTISHDQFAQSKTARIKA